MKEQNELIRIRGARQNNLKNVNLDIEPHTWTVITGPSGSGKSSLAFDTLYAEGQRRYVETFSPYARQFLERCDQPAVDSIQGVPPAIAIDQNSSVRTSRSTVGTMTELNDHLKLLFSREAQLFCQNCGQAVRRMSAFDMWSDICAKAASANDPKLILTFDVFVPNSFDKDLAINALIAQGFSKIYSERPVQTGVILSVVVDRFRASKADLSRGIEAVTTALKSGKGDLEGKFCVHALFEDGQKAVWPYATGLKCASCNITYPDANPSSFSFNSALGACPVCRGFGRSIGIDIGLIIPDEEKSLEDNCVKPWSGSSVHHECYKEMLRYAKRDGIRTNVPFRLLSPEEKTWLIEGEPGWSGKWNSQWYGIRHFFEYLETKSYKLHVRVLLSRYRSYTTCPACKGARLQTNALLWRIGSRAAADAALGSIPRFIPNNAPGIQAKIEEIPGLSLHDLMLLPISNLAQFFTILDNEIRDEPGRLVLEQIRARLRYLLDVGVGYLTLDRQSRTLSGGELQRVNLTTALGTNLVDTLFVLDEPSVGLHPRDMDRINGILRRLKDAGNTLVVVEHDPQVMLAADRIVDMGPGAGEKGGQIVYDGTPENIRCAESLTGLYLSGKLSVDAALSRKTPTTRTQWLEITGAKEHNLKDVSVKFPLGHMTVVTGVSGSGKSSLVVDTLVPSLERYFGQSAASASCSSLVGAEKLVDVHLIDQSKLTKTTRSTAALYVGAFTAIRDLFASTPKACSRGYSAGAFSFNSAIGQCPTCQGSGFEHVEMQFLSDVFLRCSDCNGKRYRPEILEVTLNLDGKREVSIADVLEMTVSEALEYFCSYRNICRALKPLKDVGLEYLHLGQPLSTLSGGEAQRIKLAGTLAKANSYSSVSGHLYILDEPTTGLHFDDIAKLLSVLRRLVAAGASVILIEHNLDVINASDWVIDLGPDGGDQGGRVVAVGTPDGIAKKKTFTGIALAAHRKALSNPKETMTGLFGKRLENQREIGRSLQSVWRKAKKGDLGIFGAREHNLKDINVVIPRKKLSVITGVSGSGKSTLAFGIIFSEGQRRYLESLNAYARSIVQPGVQPDVEQIVGIAPTVAIEQRTSRGGLKSTVATLTEIHQFLRLLFVKLGKQHCPTCGTIVLPQTFQAILSKILTSFHGKKVTIAAPLVSARKGLFTETAAWALSRGILQLRVDGKWVGTEHFPPLSRYSDHTIELPVATLVVNSSKETLLRQTLERALFHGHGNVILFWGNLAQDAEKERDGGQSFYSTKHTCPICFRSFPELDPRLFSYNSKVGWCPTCRGTGYRLPDAESLSDDDYTADDLSQETICPDCKGTRLNEIARSVFFGTHSICELTALTVDDCLKTLTAIRLTGRDKAIGDIPMKEILSRLQFLQEVGLGYLSLDRSAPSLSGGEAQRIRLASQLGNNLQGVCYVLDEPTIGLHTRDNTRLISSLIALKNKGNTVIVVEHDEEMIRQAEHVVDIGPEAGNKGGRLVAEGTLNEIIENSESITGQCLKFPLLHTGKARHPFLNDDPCLSIYGATLHNLKNIEAHFPLGKLIVLTGVSGSGKSTLARSVLLRNIHDQLSPNRSTKQNWFGCDRIEGIEHIDRVLEVDQSPIGKNPRSCPATYIGFFDQIRTVFANTNDAKIHGWTPSHFSFNTPDGRCPVCEGQGQITIAMNFLPDVRTICEVCEGKRFDKETLSIRWHEKSIGDILDMTVDDVLPIFETNSKISSGLRMMQAVGLGYLKLGQPSTTLSGGEAQRIKLVTELVKATTSNRLGRRTRTFYVLDEPTVGLHMYDVKKLISVLHTLVDAGNTVLVVEHNLDLIAEADYIIDLGPEGGADGGRIVSQGEPLAVSKTPTATGNALKEFFKTHNAKPRLNKRKK